MHCFTVSLFGHRFIEDLRRLDSQLVPWVKGLMQAKEHVVFLVGRNGEFDEYAASVIKRLQREVGAGKHELVLILPYAVSDLEYYDVYYDSVIIPESLCGAHPKAAIALKNRWMVEHSDLVIAYAERKRGGAYTALKYAEKLKKKTVNLCEM